MSNVLQALIHIFKDVDARSSKKLDTKTLVAQLNQLGVSLADIEAALANMAAWAASGTATSPTSSQTGPLAAYATQPHAGMRIFTLKECAKISKKSRGFLARAEAMGILSPQMRETVIDHLMQMDTQEQIEASHTKWITFQMLFQGAPAHHVAYLEWLIFRKVMDIH
jgi:Smg protein